MGTLIMIVGSICSIGSLVCWIMEIIAAFKNEDSPLLGILSIIPCFALGGFIIGWVKNSQWDIKNLMLIWTAFVVIGIVLNVLAATMVPPPAAP